MIPPPDMNISEWADQKRFLSSESSAEPGRWHTDRAPYQRGIMDAVREKKIHTIVIMSSSQIGKTEILNNITGFLIDQDPCPIMFMQPTIDIAQAWSKDRFDPMIRDSPCLKGKISVRSRDGKTRILHKQFPGGHITMGGANSPASLASRPIRILLMDEIDRYPFSAGDEGDPVSLAIKRTSTFWNKKIVMASTPTIRDHSRIESAYKSSDRRRFHVPCPHCHEFDVLLWSNLRRPNEESSPEHWEYYCQNCGCKIHERLKMGMLRAGRWIAERKSDGVAGFWINEMYSPWVSWAEMVKNFLHLKKLPDTLKTFVNTSLAETWDISKEGDGLEPIKIFEKTEDYDAEVPEGAFYLTAAVDVQDDRLEVEVLGWGMDRETWSICYEVVWGDPATSDVWDRLSDILFKKYDHELGVKIGVSVSVIDTGGAHAEQVYIYTKIQKRKRRRVYAIKGSSQKNRPIIDRVSRNNSYRVKLFFVGTDTAKEMIFSYLQIKDHGPGFMHHPTNYDIDYFKQLTSERKKVVYEKGKAITKWLLPGGRRNEALDLKVYNFAAFSIMKPDMIKTFQRFEATLKKDYDDDDHEKKSIRVSRPPRRRAGRFIKKW